MSQPYSFRATTRSDLPLLKAWLQTPEALRWWGEAEAEAALIEEDLDNPQMAQWLVFHADQPFAYAQAYEVHAWPQPHLADLPQGALAIDAFVGVPEMLGRGHGGRFLRLLAEKLIAEGAPLVAIDPDTDNARAIAGYRRAGFRDYAARDAEQGPVLLMLFEKLAPPASPG